MPGLVHFLEEESFVCGGGGGCLKSQSLAEFCVSLGGRMRYYTHPFFRVIWKGGDLQLAPNWGH